MEEIKINDKLLLKEAVEAHKRTAIKIAGGDLFKNEPLTLVGVSFIFCIGKDGPIAKVGLYSEGLEDDEK